MAKKSEVQKTKERLTRDRAVAPPEWAAGLSCGSCLVNMATTGRPNVCFLPGNAYLFVGDSNSGKSYLTLTSMAEAAKNRHYDTYRFIYDNVEHGAQMNLVRHFGRRMADRLEAPCTHQGQPWHSERIEDFYLNLHEALDRGPCIYVLDSMDALSSEEDQRDFLKMKQAARKAEKGDNDGKPAGSFGDGKAKKNSRLLRGVLPKLAKTGSVLIIIDQTRDNVGGFGMDPKTRSGGKALTFYAQTEMWSSVRQKLMSGEVAGRKRHVGNLCEFRVKRSRYTGRQDTVQVPIYYSAGVDDVGSCVDWLVQEEHWKKEQGKVKAPEFADAPLKRDALIELIEAGDREAELYALVAQVWADVEDRIAVRRKRRYD